MRIHLTWGREKKMSVPAFILYAIFGIALCITVWVIGNKLSNSMYEQVIQVQEQLDINYDK